VENPVIAFDDDLWSRIRDFTFNPPDASLTFEQRLARENAWSLDFAQAVIVEYKKFLYLLAKTRRELTPSDEVDQVWHLHLVYTRSYWQDLCNEVLGFPLHHQPTQGGGEQQQHFRRVYSQTLTLYREYFGAPPAAIWPDVERRFTDATAFTRINRTRTWLIRKPSVHLPLTLLTGASLLTLSACTLTEGDNDFWFWVKVGVGIWGVYMVVKTFNHFLGGTRGGGGRGGSGCSSAGCSGCCGCGGGD
jgi:hypothetical protein